MAHFLGDHGAVGSEGREEALVHHPLPIKSRTNRGGAAGARYDLSQQGHKPNVDGLRTPPTIGNGLEPTPKKSGFRNFFGKGSSNQSAQRLPGAEGFVPAERKNEGSIEDQMDFFSQQTGKLLVFRREKREVLFATPELGE